MAKRRYYLKVRPYQTEELQELVHHGVLHTDGNAASDDAELCTIRPLPISSDDIKLAEVELLSVNNRNATEALLTREMVWIFFRDVTPCH